MKWFVKKLELNPEQAEGTKDIELPEGAIPITLSAAYLYYIQPEPWVPARSGHMGMCQVIGCTEEATYRVKVCPKHREGFTLKEEE